MSIPSFSSFPQSFSSFPGVDEPEPKKEEKSKEKSSSKRKEREDRDERERKSRRDERDRERSRRDDRERSKHRDGKDKPSKSDRKRKDEEKAYREEKRRERKGKDRRKEKDKDKNTDQDRPVDSDSDLEIDPTGGGTYDFEKDLERARKQHVALRHDEHSELDLSNLCLEDRRGDAGNIQYGSLNKRDVPKFFRAGCESCFGFEIKGGRLIFECYRWKCAWCACRVEDRWKGG